MRPQHPLAADCDALLIAHLPAPLRATIDGLLAGGAKPADVLACVYRRAGESGTYRSAEAYLEGKAGGPPPAVED